MSTETIAVVVFLCLLIAIPAGVWLGYWAAARDRERRR